jgi:hypothetical protein
MLTGEDGIVFKIKENALAYYSKAGEIVTTLRETLG